MTEHARASSQLPHPAAVILTDRKLVRITGPGTDKFLHGQFSQSLEAVTSAHSLRAAACTPKGRAYCLTRLVRDGEDILLDLPVELAEEIHTRLQKYLMLFRGTRMEIPEEGHITGLLGKEAALAISPDAEQLTDDGATLALPGGHLLRTTDTAEGLPRYEYWRPGGETSLPAQLPAATLADWHWSEIAAGVPSLNPASNQQYVPQMLNWQHLNGIHFKKGCYTGQEVIARMHFLGQLKKSLFRLQSDTATEGAAEPGSPVMAGGREAGRVVNCITLDNGGVAMLAVLRHANQGDPLTLADGTPVSIQPLPYRVPEREDTPARDT